MTQSSRHSPRAAPSSVAPTSPALAGDELRSERLLAAMHRVFSHDLPNQLVVVQSLINLLAEEENNLSADGREILTRLAQAAQRAGGMVDFLKEMARLSKLVETMEVIPLAALARELQAALTHLYPQRRVCVAASWAVDSVYAGRRSLQQAVVQLARCGIEHFRSDEVKIVLASGAAGPGVEISLGIEPGNAQPLPNATSLRQDRSLPELRLEFVLAREMLAIWGGSLTARPQPGQSYFFVIGVPRV
jgi:signal transduction histidine kinase